MFRCDVRAVANSLVLRSNPVAMVAPLIFLDIDGVICCNRQGQLQELQLAQLSRMCQATGAKVVLSSDWRRVRRLKEIVQQALKRHGISYVGCTAQRICCEDIGNKRYEHPCRALEITDWLRKFRGGVDACTWVAVDDRDLNREVGGEEMAGHLLHTTFDTGLTCALADDGIRILGESRS